ncbi:MAG: penicillin-binding protein 2, partial [Alphaproteobacteria bacterium]
MYRDPKTLKIFNRRALLVGGGQAALFSVLAARLYHLQVIQADRYAMLADENRINLRLIPPPRGRILDRYGEPLAVNSQNYRAVIVRERAPDLGATLAAFASIVALTEAERKRVLRALRRKRPFVTVIVKENLSWAEVSRIAVNSPDLPGVTIVMGQSRHYPQGVAAAHALGYVAAVSEADLTGDPLLELPGFQIGKSGAEKLHDHALRGTAGTSQLEVNAVGRVIRELSRDEGEPGAEINLTLDLALQRLATERLRGESAAAAVVDVDTGEVLTLVSTPGFDPGEFSRGLDAKAWRALTSNPRAPLTNKAIAGQYAPGSTIKAVIALAAMEAGVANPDHRVFCTGKVALGTAKFHCWKRGGHGWVDMADAIAQSCDVYFYDLARKLGIDRIAAMARRFGLGAPLDLDLPGEKPGLVPTRDWKRAVIGTPWQQGETLVAGIGQGFFLATPLQLAMMTARLVNGGRTVPPYLTRRPPASEGDAPPPAER